MPLWRYAVITLLREAATRGVLETDHTPHALRALLQAQYERWWNIDIKRFRSTRQFLAYAARYARRPPIAQRRFRATGPDDVRFLTKDTRTKRTVQTRYTPAKFLALLGHHVPDRYRHGVRLFGLLAPRLKHQTHAAIFDLVGQERLAKPPPLRWASSLRRSFGVDPLVDRDGHPMHWVRRVAPSSGP